MKAKNPNYMNGFYRAEDKSLWKWKGIERKKKRNDGEGLSVTEFIQENLQKIEEAVEGPGGGAGIGCGVGVGLGLVGGVGYGGWPWNQVKMVFGVGMGCGVGVGFGYAQGYGVGISFESLKSHVFKTNNPHSKKRIIVQI